MSAFTDQLPDVFAKFGAITLRAMFGGHGIYHSDTMFALVADGVLYLKTDSGNVQYFNELGLEAFEYIGKDGRTARMSYHRAPDDIFENPAKAAVWARRSHDAALRAQAKRR
jgi:DNA transformation protein